MEGKRGSECLLKSVSNIDFNPNIHLVRLCINGGRHYNADGTFADGNHIHLYHFIKGLGEVEAHVYPLTSTPFGDPQSLIEDLEKFIAYVHVKNN
ncbi:DUF6978 family protein [Lacticaseibacillus paracasei]|uniref:DUF6978 family protein n=1 Tax=Lacticaseibacillus paracasei TaxID=1597 RepID=UPI003AF1B6E3